MRNLVVISILLLISTYLPAQRIFYVSPNGDDLNEGDSWNMAVRNIQIGIDKAFNSGGGQVWVAQGTYLPTSHVIYNVLGSYTISIELRNNVEIYGGFIGAETLLTERDYKKNETIISGQLTSSLNSHHVIVGNVDNTSILDGFTIKDGDNYSGTPDRSGGGLYLTGGKIMNCVIKNCGARSGGGADVKNTYFFNCLFTKNTANGGAAISGLNCKIYNCIIKDNNASYSAGGCYLSGNSFIVNSIIRGNYDGGGIRNAKVIVNCTFIYNNASISDEGGAYMHYNDSEAYMLNSCVYGNKGDYQLVARDITKFSMMNCAVENKDDCANFDLSQESNVIFLSESPFIDSNLNLTNNSSCINAGIVIKEPTSVEYPFMYESNGVYKIKINSDLEVDMPKQDVYGNNRISGGTIDVGAVEFQSTPTIIENPITSEEEFCIFPNPVKNVLNFKPLIEKAEITIYSTQGAIVFNDKNFTGNNIDVSKFNNGHYILKIKTTESFIHRSFIKLD